MERILIIDDDESTISILTQILQDEGYEVVTAHDGEEGLAQFHSKPMDLVISDMVMPVKDGLDTILELKKIVPDLPVIAISAGGKIAKERYLEVAAYLGNTKTLAKPFSREQIVGAVKEQLAPDQPVEGIRL